MEKRGQKLFMRRNILHRTHSNTPTESRNCKSRSPPIEKPKHRRQVSEFSEILGTMKQFPKVYDMFINEAKDRKIIPKRLMSGIKYHKKYIYQKPASSARISRSRAQSKSPSISNSPSQEKSVKINRSQSPPVISIGSLIQNTVLEHKTNNAIWNIQILDTSATSFNRSTTLPLPGVPRKMNPRQSLQQDSITFGAVKQTMAHIFNQDIPMIVNRHDEKLQKLFMDLWGSTDKKAQLSASTLEKFLKKRYPSHIAKAVIDFFHIEEDFLYEKYCTMLDKIMHVSEKIQKTLVFKMFDINEDQYICFNDVYKIMIDSHVNNYNSDISTIQENQSWKKLHGTIKTGMSKLASAIAGRKEEKEVKRHKQQGPPQHNPAIPEAITLKEFQKITFAESRPRIIFDLLEYLGKFNYYKYLGIQPQKRRRQNSEDYLKPLRFAGDKLQELGDHPRYFYFEELLDAMIRFKPEVCQRLLDKFNLLKCYYERYSMITKKSMQENFKRVFQRPNDYLAERLYAVLTGPEHVDLFKPQWLREIYAMIHGTRIEKMKFLYRLFNAAEDGKLKVNEIMNMMDTFQPDTKGYNECMMLGNAIWQSQMGKTGIRMEYISMPYFSMLLRHSEILKMLTKTLTLQQDWKKLIQQAVHQSALDGHISKKDIKWVQGNLKLIRKQEYKIFFTNTNSSSMFQWNWTIGSLEKIPVYFYPISLGKTYSFKMFLFKVIDYQRMLSTNEATWAQRQVTKPFRCLRGASSTNYDVSVADQVCPLVRSKQCKATALELLLSGHL